jgi:hypothetical protein
MSREEDVIRVTTRAIAAAVRDVPPLQLEPAPGELWPPRHRPHQGRPSGIGPRLRSWLAPATAAALVVAVAVTLVLARGPQNGGMVPQPALTGSGPGGVPRYYVAVHPVADKGGGTFNLLVGDALTGQTLADINPPAHMRYASVTAAADDRTFLAFATDTNRTGRSGRWYALHLAPGTEHVVSLTPTPIHPQSGVVASALSGSGTLLAVAEYGTQGQGRLIVFSVATGRPLRAWSTKAAPAMWSASSTQENLLTWIDGDRAVAFLDGATARAESVRRLNVGGPPGADDLFAGSQLIWSAPPDSALPCGIIPPMVSADGHTIACVTASAEHFQLTIAWRGYQASALAPAAGKYTTAYQLTRQVPGKTTFFAGTLWISPSGSALVGYWAIDPSPFSTTRPSSSGSASATPRLGDVSTGIGVMSHGTFTPLRLPQHILNPLSGAAIAW